MSEKKSTNHGDTRNGCDTQDKSTKSEGKTHVNYTGSDQVLDQKTQMSRKKGRENRQRDEVESKAGHMRM